MPWRDIHGPNASPGPQNRAYHVVAVPHRHPCALPVRNDFVLACQPALGHADGRQVRQYTEVACKAEAPRVGDPLPVADHQVRATTQRLDGVKKNRNLPERQQPWYVGKGGGTTGNGVFYQLQARVFQKGDSPTGHPTLFLEGHVRAGDLSDVAEVVLRDDPAAEILVLVDSFANIYSLAMMRWGSSAGLVAVYSA